MTDLGAMREQIRAAQEEAVTEAERRLAAGEDPIVLDGTTYQRESLWAATSAIRKTWELDGLYGGQERTENGWFAIVHVPLGRFADAPREDESE